MTPRLNLYALISAFGLLAFGAPAAAYELNPECEPFFPTWPSSPLLENEMLRIKYDYDRANSDLHMKFLPLLPGPKMDLSLIGGNPGTPSADLRLAFFWSHHRDLVRWPNANYDLISYEVLEDHFAQMDTRLSLTLYLGHTFMWIESVADGAPSEVVTSPVFFGLSNPHSNMNEFLDAVDAYEGRLEDMVWGIVNSVDRCHQPLEGSTYTRFEEVIDKEYSQNPLPIATKTNAAKAAIAVEILDE